MAAKTDAGCSAGNWWRGPPPPADGSVRGHHRPAEHRSGRVIGMTLELRGQLDQLLGAQNIHIRLCHKAVHDGEASTTAEAEEPRLGYGIELRHRTIVRLRRLRHTASPRRIAWTTR